MAQASAKPHPIGPELSFGGFQNLMPHRVHNIVLVSSLYESFILEEEGLLNELITSEYLEMKLSQAPRVSRVSTGAQALEFVKHQDVDLIITMTHLRHVSIADFGRAVKRLKPDLPVVVLADNPRELHRQPELTDRSCIDRAFVWHGDAKILLAIIKYVEDRLNAEHDTRFGEARIIILVENSVWFYSTYLPLIYTELVKLTHSLMTEGLNPTQRLLRMRARPKILLADTFEEAWDLYSKFSENVLGVISDVRFPRNGVLDSEAGLEFTRRIRQQAPYLPVLLQSSDTARAEQAAELRACFLNKNSPSLLQELRDFMLRNMGFGDFVFQFPDGTEVARAHDLRSLEEALAHVPDECLRFHAENNHFSNWLMARSEFELASRLRPRRVSEFADITEVRGYLIKTVAEFWERSRSGVVTEFSAESFDTAATFARIGGGSMGGKARGLAFVNTLIRHHGVRDRFPDVDVAVPNSAAISTDVFDAFVEQNRLRELAARETDDIAIARAFVEAALPGDIVRDLVAFLRLVRYPLAVRSSSLLEDALDRPFAGIYSTQMIPNNHPSLKVRLDQLCDAIKLVYASTFFRSARGYREAAARYAEEEKMGVILQELVGSQHGHRFYPTFSGVARSYNFYAAAQMAPADGVAYVALGLGKMVVEGGGGLMFSPAHPRILPQFATTQDMLANSQREFYALDLSRPNAYPTADAEAHLRTFGLEAAESDGTLAPIGSVYSAEDDAVYDGLSRSGCRLVTFAHVLKSDLFPLAEILRTLLEIGRDGMTWPVEIEFAVDMTSRPMRFGFLQIRPTIWDEEQDAVSMDERDLRRAVCFSSQTMGNGRIRSLHDVIYVKPEAFDSAHTRQIAAEIGRLNDDLTKAGRSCVLIGPGRWGSADRWLGIPVTWEQISSARVIVETTLDDFRVTPSQGTHFFQNLVSLRVGYFTVDAHTGQGNIDWDWLAGQQAVAETRFVRHIRLDQPLDVRMDGRSQRGAILKSDRGS